MAARPRAFTTSDEKQVISLQWPNAEYMQKDKMVTDIATTAP